MNSNVIQERQNEEYSLQTQYAARVCFNAAERFNRLAWIACLISAFSVFLPKTWPEYVLYGIPFVFDLIAAFFTYLASKKVILASNLRKAFDSYVLDFVTDPKSESDHYRLKEKVIKICSKDPNKTVSQIANSGKDSPPGVRDWYVFSNPIDGIRAQFECQRQNAWWNTKLSPIRYALSCVCVVVVGVIFFCLARRNGILFSILCSAGLLLRIIERIVVNYKYIYISKSIEGALQTMEAHPTLEGIRVLQNLIDQRRAINVLEMNLLHRKAAERFTNLYEKISTK